MDRRATGDVDQRGGTSYFLEPGYVYFSRREAVVRAVLGSCVAVCLWDKKLHHGGMNHYCMPATRKAEEATPRYGNAATAALVRMMEDAGSRSNDIVAQIFGGGSPEEATGDDIGAQNVEAARQVLVRRSIKVVSEDVGGEIGRKIVFDIGTGHVAVLRVQKIRESDWRGERT